jgi:hypothetical protein
VQAVRRRSGGHTPGELEPFSRPPAKRASKRDPDLDRGPNLVPI